MSQALLRVDSLPFAEPSISSQTLHFSAQSQAPSPVCLIKGELSVLEMCFCSKHRTAREGAKVQKESFGFPGGALGFL